MTGSHTKAAQELPMTISEEPRSTGAVRLHEIAAGLTAVGLVTHLHRTRAGTDLTATLHLPGYHDIEVIADEDGYTELRYWCQPQQHSRAHVATIAASWKRSRPPNPWPVAQSRHTSRLPVTMARSPNVRKAAAWRGPTTI